MLVPLHQQIRLLSAADVLEPLSEEELMDFALRNLDRHLQPGESLYNPYQRAEKLYIVKEGKIRLYRTNSEGEELILAIATKGDVFGEMSFTDQHLRGARQCYRTFSCRLF